MTGLRLPAIGAAVALALILLGSMHATGGGDARANWPSGSTTIRPQPGRIT